MKTETEIINCNKKYNHFQWQFISLYENLSEDFIIKHKRDVKWKIIIHTQKMTEKILMDEFVYKIIMKENIILHLIHNNILSSTVQYKYFFFNQNEESCIELSKMPYIDVLLKETFINSTNDLKLLKMSLTT